MAGKKGRSGHKKATTTLIKEALEKNDNFLLQYLDALRDIALDPNAKVRQRIECLIYLINRSQGTPKVRTDMRIEEQSVNITAELLEVIRNRQLEGYKLEGRKLEPVDIPLLDADKHPE